MKRLFCLLLAALIVAFFVAACGKGKDGSVRSRGKTMDVDNVDLDLARLSGSVAYSAVCNMLSSPDDYIGKTVRMRGQFAYYEDPVSKNQYFACVIADAASCCSQGFEFVLVGEHSYPIDYPELGAEITVTGTFGVYEENGFQYCRLEEALIENSIE